MALTDRRQRVMESYDYDSFGNIKRKGDKVKNTYTFTGREWDREIGLYYYRARYYDPKAGRFPSKDPIGFGGGDVNLYAYVRNNPVNLTDPLGLQSTECPDCPSGIWSGAGGNVGGMLLSGGVFTGIYRVTCWDSGKSCWIMTTCSGSGLGLGGSVSGESIWIRGARSSRDLGGRTEGGLAFGGPPTGLIGAGGSLSGGGKGNPITGPIPNPSPSSSISYGAGFGLGAGYLVGGCNTSILRCN